jgi:hypothetical protein
LAAGPGTVAGVDAVVVFFAALAGAGIGAYGGLTVERLRGRRELDLQRREDIKDGLLALNEQAAGALRICADLEATDHWPALYDEDWRRLRAKQLPGQAADMLIAWSRVEVLLPDTSTLEQRVSEYFDVLVAPDGAQEGGGGGRLQRAAAAHAELKNAIRDQLDGDGDGATPGWQVMARRILPPRQ